ncbi:chemotaxis protein CheA [Thiobacter aerophilum]|uniref:histidine kinase n=1 Tax=Thiobacter aerophilum TaxID=3121275 RepID=A0ABV0EB39_9BURK
MSAFEGMEDLLQDFLTEATDLLSEVDNRLVELEKSPNDKELLNQIFRGFHTIKGGAGFLNATPLVELCHRTENLFDKLRNGEMSLNPEIMDVILAATAAVREMFGYLAQGRMPEPTDKDLMLELDAVLAGEKAMQVWQNQAAHTPQAPVEDEVPSTQAAAEHGPDWRLLYHALLGSRPEESPGAERPAATNPASSAPPARLEPKPAPAKSTAPAGKETTIRIDTARLDQVLNLSGEIGLTKNRLNCLRADILAGKTDLATLKALDEAVSQLDLLVGDLQNAVMKTRMQPIGRLFQKYPRLARDLARSLGKEVELILEGEDTEIDKTMIEDLNDPLVHLVRNAVDHGVDSPEERLAAGKPAKSVIKLSAQQVGDHIVIEIADDGRGIRPDVIRRKALEKGLIDVETANSLDERQSLNLIFLPGFSTKDQISDVSGRGVGMDVVKTNITRLNGRIDIRSVVGQGTTFTITLPLTLAILPVLIVRLGQQPFAVPLSMVREIIPIRPHEVQQVSGRATLVVRDEVLPVKTLAGIIGWPEEGPPSFGVLMQSGESTFVLAIDGFIGRDDVVIKPLQGIKPHGVAGATLSGDGQVVLVLDMEALLSSETPSPQASLFRAAG